MIRQHRRLVRAATSGYYSRPRSAGEVEIRYSKRGVASGGGARWVCNCCVFIRLTIHDRILGPEPVTPADLKREADHERLIRAFPVAGEVIEPE
jgi:hypothetical protein